MKVWRYSRWDGSQQAFSLDADAALDALSDLMMEGLSAEEALAWMQRAGFELAGLDMRVMGVEELLDELRSELQSLEQRYRMDEATADLRRRLAEILDREQRAQREQHGYESQRMNEFLERRNRPDASLSDAIERFRDWDFADAEAGEEFRELLERARAHAPARSVPRAARRSLPRQRSRRLRDGAADPRTHRSVRSSSRAISPSGNFQPIDPERAARAPFRGRAALAGAAARPARVARTRRPPARRRRRPALAARDPPDRRAGARDRLRRAAQGSPGRSRHAAHGCRDPASRRDATLAVRRRLRRRRREVAAQRGQAESAWRRRSRGHRKTSRSGRWTTRPSAPRRCCCST